MKEVVRSACRTALLEAGFTPDDYEYMFDGNQSPGLSEFIRFIIHDELQVYGGVGGSGRLYSWAVVQPGECRGAAAPPALPWLHHCP